LKYVIIPKLENEVASLGFGDKKKQKMVDDVVTAQNVASVVARATGIPVDNLLSSERQKLLHLEDKLEERVIGQNKAVQAIANCVRLSRAGLRSHDRPLGVFMFLGPTGVGK
jgi:ATP-dependent Clp protease ATP-binding subunit ClpB